MITISQTAELNCLHRFPM